MATINSVLVHFVMATEFHVELQVQIYELKFWGGLRSICSLDKPDRTTCSHWNAFFRTLNTMSLQMKLGEFYICLVHRLLALNSLDAIFVGSKSC